MSPGVTIETRTVGTRTLVTIAGVVDEHASFDALAALTGDVEINLRGLRRFNSVGIREWVDALRPLSKRARVVYVECSPPVIAQLNSITGFLGEGVVRSFFAPMVCPRCQASADQLLGPSARDDGVESIPCPECGAPMELDELEDQYLLFLREPTRVG